MLRLLNETLTNRIGVNISQLLIEKCLASDCYRMIALFPDLSPVYIFILKYSHPEEVAEFTLLAQVTFYLLAGVTLEITDNIGNLIGASMADDGMYMTGHDCVRVNFQPLIGLAKY